MPGQDLRNQPLTKVPRSGWSVTGLPIPDAPDDGYPLRGAALSAWHVYFQMPVSVTWGVAELVLLKRLAENASDYHDARFAADQVDDNGKPLGSAAQASRISTEMRNLEAQLGITTKGRRELKLAVVPDAEFLAWYADPAEPKSAAIHLVEFEVENAKPIEEVEAEADELTVRRNRFAKGA